MPTLEIDSNDLASDIIQTKQFPFLHLELHLISYLELNIKTETICYYKTNSISCEDLSLNFPMKKELPLLKEKGCW
jgi:hypothetical protein